MADRDYNIRYSADPTDAVAGTTRLAQVLVALDALVDRIKAKLKGLYSGFGASSSDAAGSTATVSKSFEELQFEVNNTTKVVNNYSTTIKQAAKDHGGLTASLIEMRAAMFALQEVREVIRAIADGLKEARDFARETAEENLKLLDSMRELAALRGKQGPDERDQAGAVGLMLDAGFKDPQDARQFMQFFEGAIPVAETKGNLAPAKGTPDDLKRDMARSAARLSVAKGVDPETAAKLAASIATTKKITDVKQVEAELQLMIENLNAAPDEVSPLAKQVLRTRGAMIAMGYAANVPEVASMITAIDINNPAGRSGTRLESVAMDLSTATSGKSKGKLAKLGITPDKRDLLDFFQKIKPVIDEANAPGGVGAIAALKDLGFKQGRAIIEAVKVVQELDFLEAQMKNNRAVLADPAAVAAKAAQLNASLDKFKATDKTGRFAGAELEAARFLRGLQTQELQVERTSATAGLIAGGRIKTAAALVMKKINDGFDPQVTLGGKDTEQVAIDAEVARRLIVQAHDAGLSDADIRRSAPEMHRVAGGGGRMLGDQPFGRQVSALKDRIAGGKGFSPAVRDQVAMQRGAGIAERVRRIAAGEKIPRAGGAFPGQRGPGAAPQPPGLLADAGELGKKLDRLVDESIRTNLILGQVGPAGGAQPGRK